MGWAHWALECPAQHNLRGEANAAAGDAGLTEEWLLAGGSADVVRIKVRLVGRALGRVVAELRAAWARRRAEAEQESAPSGPDQEEPVQGLQKRRRQAT